MTENNNNTAEKFRKVLFNEVTFIASIIAIVIGVVLFIMGPDAELQQDVALIKQSINTIETNHLIDLEADIKENKDAIDVLDDKIDKIMIHLGVE